MILICPWVCKQTRQGGDTGNYDIKDRRLTKKRVAEQDIPKVENKNKLHEGVMNDSTKGEPLAIKTFQDVLNHFKKKNKNMFRHINKSGSLFQDAMFVYMTDFMDQEMVPDTYDYTKLFGLWKGKGNKLI